jgi:hypothetical protein
VRRNDIKKNFVGNSHVKNHTHIGSPPPLPLVGEHPHVLPAEQQQYVTAAVADGS